ncbi:MAG: SDR family NAD(P)-dependent oxidoreductase [Vulcanimicrobiaceae bacterium]
MATARSIRKAMIVTGASSGIGRALALAAARAGYGVTVVARRAERLETLRAEIHAFGGLCTVVVADVCALDAPRRIVEATVAAFGRVDILVNNAGAGAPGRLLEQSQADLDAQWQLHVVAPLRLTRAALDELRDVRGGVAFVGSGLARVPLPEFGAYCLAKAAVRGAATQLRRELHQDGIAISYIDPGTVNTEFSQASGTGNRAPARFLVPAEPVARAILRGLERRSANINAVPSQAALVVLGEWCWPLVDRLVMRPRAESMPRPKAPPMTAGSTAGEPASVSATKQMPVSDMQSVQPSAPRSKVSFSEALAPVARRMERVKLSPAFLQDSLVAGTTLDLHELAMRWAGMPNKNERAVLREALEALASARFLEPTGETTWRVLRDD